MRTKDFHNGWSPVAGIAFVAVLMIAVPMDLVGQTQVQVEDILGLAPSEVDQTPRLGGAWVRVERTGEGSLDCEGFPVDARGVPRGGCRFSMEQLKLTERALAWIEFHDELIEGKFYCVPESIPSRWVFGGGAVRIDQRTSRIVQEWQQGETSNFNIFITRTIWMDGRSHPAPSDPDYVSIGDMPLAGTKEMNWSLRRQTLRLIRTESTSRARSPLHGSNASPNAIPS